MKNYLSIIISIVVTTLSIAQEDSDEVNYYNFNNVIIPPTPEVASLGKYVETPINEFTGVPRIQIPIYSIQQGKIKHDINLSYHAQGVKVEEIASRVGMGWSLNAGGIISRQKRGRPDESTNGYLNTSYTVSNFIETGVDIVRAVPFFNAINSGLRDYEPDVFTYNFGGYSGSFFFDQETRKPIFNEVSPLNVEWIGSNFKITTPDGLQYFFGSGQVKGGSDVLDVYTRGQFYSSSVDETDVNNYPEYIATWYLTSIYDSTSDESITFNYKKYDIGKLRQRLSSAVLLEERPAPRISFEHTLSEQKVYENVLTQINFTNGRVSFIEDEDVRADQNGSYALKQINVYANNNKIIKSFGLNHDMITSNDSGDSNDDLYSFYSSANRTKRLFLSNLREFKINKSNNTVLYSDFKEHSFDYNKPENLPHRFSSAQDLWGFYNGAESNTNLLPTDYERIKDRVYDLGDANRQVNVNYSQTGVLTKITYPTGGFVKYTYENNRAKKDFTVDATKGSRLNPLYESFTIVPVSQSFNEKSSNVKYVRGSSPFYEMKFDLEGIIRYDPGGEIIPIKVKINYTNNHNYYFQHPNCPNNCFHHCAVDNSGSGSDCFDDEYWYPTLSSGSGTKLNINNNAGRLHNRSGLNEFYLEQGKTYTIKIFFDEFLDEGPYDARYHGPDDWNISVKYDKNELVSLTDDGSVLTGGLRVKEIVIDDLTGNVEKTKYLYKYENNLTSGNFVSVPYHVSGIDYYYLKDVYETTCYPCKTEKAGSEYVIGRKFSSESSVPLATTQGSYTGYEKVTKISEGGDNGKTEYNFSFERDKLFIILQGNASNIPDTSFFSDLSPVPLQNNEVYRGNLLSQIEYNEEGDIVEQTINTYDITKNDDVNALTSRLVLNGSEKNSIFPGNVRYGLGTNVFYITNQYRLFSRLKLLTGSATTTYDINGENPVTTTTAFNYENNTFPSLQTGSITTNSKNETIENKIYYPDDITSTRSLAEGGNLTGPEYIAIQRLQKDDVEHRIGQPVQQETYVNDVLTSVQRTNFSTTNSVTLPSSIESAYHNENLEEKVTYESYTENGNLEEISRPDGVHTSYLWGYNSQYPVAKIENATVTSIEARLSTSELTNIEEGTYSDNELRVVLNKIRTGLPDAMVTSYTYDPLVGITSMTDPKGYTMYYEYDGFQRLESVKDVDGNLLSTNDYNYKN